MTYLEPSPFGDIWSQIADQIDPQPHPYEDDPVLWVKNILDEHMTLDQRKIIESVRDYRYTAVKSCHDVGKSYTASRAVCWWLDTHDPGEAFVVTTAPTRAQVEAILWREIGRAHRKGGLLGRVTGDAQWKFGWGSKDSPDELIAFGRKPADYDPAAFQGIHARYVLVVIDEACGVPKTIFDAVDALATNENARVLAIGNPDDPASHFATVCKPGSGWNTIRINALESPNFTPKEVSKYPRVADLMDKLDVAPNIERTPERVRDLLVGVNWVDERIKRWGVDSPLFVSKVLGEFPEVSNDSLIEVGWVTQAQYRSLPSDIHDAAFGVDVARYGSDKTIICERNGGKCRIVWEAGKTPVTQTVGRVEMHVNLHKGSPIANVDDTGIGGGVTDLLQEDGYEVRALISSGKPTEFWPNGRPKFLNLRAQWYWALREAFRLGEIDVDPADEDLAAQLVNLKYGINSSGMIYVESKDDMKKRGVDSPDRADALCYSWVRGSFGHAGAEIIAHHAGHSMTSDLLKMEF